MTNYFVWYVCTPYYVKLIVANNEMKICNYKSINICTLVVKFLLTVYSVIRYGPGPDGDG